MEIKKESEGEVRFIYMTAEHKHPKDWNENESETRWQHAFTRSIIAQLRERKLL